MSCVCRRGPSLTDLLKTPHSSLAIHMAHTQCAHFERPLFVRACACTCVLVCAFLSFQEANLLLFTLCSTTCAPFNLGCCSHSLFQSAVV